MRLNAFAYISAVLGAALVSVGFISEATALGNNGLCQGQLVETFQPNGTWKVTGSICSGFCPHVEPPQRNTCEKTGSGPSQNMGGVIVHSKVCACVKYGPDPRWPGSEMVIGVQIDRVDPNNPQSAILCDVEHRSTSTGQFHSAICDFHCQQGHCSQSQPSAPIMGGEPPTTGSVRVRTCLCP